jgi:hypothetical protein
MNTEQAVIIVVVVAVCAVFLWLMGKKYGK